MAIPRSLPEPPAACQFVHRTARFYLFQNANDLLFRIPPLLISKFLPPWELYARHRGNTRRYSNVGTPGGVDTPTASSIPRQPFIETESCLYCYRGVTLPQYSKHWRG